MKISLSALSALGAFEKMGYFEKPQRGGMFIARMLKELIKPQRGGMERLNSWITDNPDRPLGVDQFFQHSGYKHAAPLGLFRIPHFFKCTRQYSGNKRSLCQSYKESSFF